MKIKLAVIATFLSSLLVVGCSEPEPEIDPSVPVKSEKDLKPGEPRPTAISSAAGGGPPAGGESTEKK